MWLGSGVSIANLRWSCMNRDGSCGCRGEMSPAFVVSGGFESSPCTPGILQTCSLPLEARFRRSPPPTPMFEEPWSLGTVVPPRLAPLGWPQRVGGPSRLVRSTARNLARQWLAVKDKDELVDFCSSRLLLLINSTIKPQFFATKMPKKFCPTMQMTRPSPRCARSFDRSMTRHCP